MTQTSFQIREDAVIPTNYDVHYGPVPDTQIRFISYEGPDPENNNLSDHLMFDLINAPPSHANALRRTLLSRVPSVAIEGVSVVENTGVMPDEVVCHRLCLVPIAADPFLLDYPQSPNDICETYDDPERCILFGLNVIGGSGPQANYDGAQSDWEGHLPPIYCEDCVVTSGNLVWLPFPGQRETFPNGIQPLYKDIPITKLRPGQQIHLYCRCIKGIGIDHAKFSPVATAFYRLVPAIQLQGKIIGENAINIKKSCHQGVFDIEDSELKVVNPRNCTSCRECIRDEKNKGLLKLGKEAGVYEFSVESVGVIPAPVLVEQAFEILAERCETIRGKIQSAIN